MVELPVEVVGDRDVASVLQALTTQAQPRVLRGFVAGWPAVEAANQSDKSISDYLLRFAVEQPVTVYANDTDNGRFFYNHDFTGFNFRAGKATLKDVLSQLANTQRAGELSSIYVGSTPVEAWLPGFSHENALELGVDDALVSFWLGSQTTISAHHDFPENIACIVAGRRTFTLFPPDQIDNLYIGPLDMNPSGQAISLVDFDEPDFAKFPKFSDALAHAYVAELEPGDAIFIPSMWWHHVRANETFNLLINYWWCRSPNYLGSPTVAMMNAILSLRDLPDEQKSIWRDMLDFYVFEAREDRFAHIPEQALGCLAPLDLERAKQLRTQILNRLKQ